ncbi:hypothetical protein L596_002274 [Steinernema carpocapsae]|uniref:Acyltransferase 3 domain-containing protein n=1 Tax=Steinernema carpocapsae TaxID=34508 RepID=A0A4U8UNT4_STECR|nr:hypothetical protein L596_002274 [Steinernema carpocapsae]
MWVIIFASLFFASSLLPADAHLQNFGSEDVLKYFDTVPRGNVSAKCADSLGKVRSYMNAYDTIEAQREFFWYSFTRGDADEFVSRDQDRWIYRAYKCVRAAGETSYSASENPLSFCYGFNEADHSSPAYGVCIPTPCANDDDKDVLLTEWQKKLSKDKDHSVLDYNACTGSRHEKQWYERFVPMSDFGLDILLVLFVAMATVFEIVRGNASKSTSARLLLAFSAKKNLYKLCAFPKDPQATVTCMFGIRFLSMVWTLVGHSFIFVQAYLENVDEYKDDLVDNFWNQWITNFTLSVDAFLTLSGCLTAYSWFRKWQKNTTEAEPGWTSWGYWLRFYRHRVIRLWPAYIYTILTVTTRISVTHYHPMWPPTDPAVQCPVHWWENVFFINSLTENRCMPWTWYIGTEFIFFVLSPIFLISLRRRPVVGLALSVVTIVLSGGLNAAGMLYYNFPPTQFLWKQPAIFNPDFIAHHLLMYIKPQYRIGPYIVGLLLGFYLAHFQKQTQKTGRPLKHQLIGWTLSFLGGFWAIFGLYPSLQGWDWPIYHLFFGAAHRTVFSLSLAWLIYACHTGIGGIINRILSMKPLLPLSNLCYSVYLFHMIPVVFTYLLAPFPMWFGQKWRIGIHCLIQLCIAYFFGVICTFVAELPAQNIEAIFLYTKKKSTPLKALPPASDCEMQLKTGAELPMTNKVADAK